jgi:hypothetical protein
LITDRIRRITFRGQVFWQHDSRTSDWEIQPATFIRKLLRAYGFRSPEVVLVLRSAKISEVKPPPIVTRMVHGSEAICSVSTWVGRRYANETQTREWLARNGFNTDEIRSLFAIADTLKISADEMRPLRALAAHGIRA